MAERSGFVARRYRMAAVVAAVLVLPLAALLIIEGVNLAAANGTARMVGLPEVLDPEPIRILAERRLAANDWSNAIIFSKLVLAKAPLNRRALRTLAFAELGRGHDKSALSLINLSAQLSWHDPVVEMWLFEVGLDLGAFDDAARRADAIARSEGFTADGFDDLQRLARAGGASDVAARLTARPAPRYRSIFLQSLQAADRGQAETIERLFAALQRSSSPPTEAEIAPVADRLIQSGSADVGWKVWRGSAPPSGLIWDDPDLANSASALMRGEPRVAFEWSIDPTSVEVVAKRDPAGHRALGVSVAADGAPWVISRYALLPRQRDYTLRYSLAGPDLTARLLPRAQCTTAHADLALKPKFSRASPDGYELRATTFTVPNGCGAVRVGFSSGPAGREEPQVGYIRSVDVHQD